MRFTAVNDNFVPLWGDFSALRMRHLRKFNIPIPDVLVGGTPCQGFSIAGLRGSMSDNRSNLAFSFVRLAHAIDNVRLRGGATGLAVLWENVPGVLSMSDNAFGCLLAGFVGADNPLCSPLERGRWPDAGMVAGPRARAAWRILDAQYFGLAQRRRRVFLVVSFRDGPDPAAILFERQGLHGSTPPSREAREGVAPTLDVRAGRSGETSFATSGGLVPEWPAEVAPTLDSHYGDKMGLENQHIQGGADSSFPEISHCLNAGGMGRQDYETETLIPTSGGYFDVAIPIQDKATRHSGGGNTRNNDGSANGLGIGKNGDPFPTLGAHDIHAVAHSLRAQSQSSHRADTETYVTHTLSARYDSSEDGCGRGTPLVVDTLTSNGDAHSGFRDEKWLVPMAFQAQASVTQSMNLSEQSPSLDKSKIPAVAAFKSGQGSKAGSIGYEEEISPTLGAADSGTNRTPALLSGMAVRRLMPVECEKLQGFPPEYTLVPYRGKPAADGPRYKALGNSMAVPCMYWLGQRIQMVEEIL